MPGLGLRHFMHPKSYAYNLRPWMNATPAVFREKSWEPSRIIDQGNSGTCTGAGLEALYEGDPIPHDSGPSFVELYRMNVRNDTWPDNDGDSDPSLPLESLQAGSSVDAAMKTGQQLGWWKEFRWCRSFEDASEWIRRVDGTPLLLGINWYRGFSDPDPEGVIRLSGRIEGGHCIKALWHDVERGLWTLQQSWGEGFGQRGLIYLPDDDFDRVCFREQGEVACAVEMLPNPDDEIAAERQAEFTA